jgi:hypothetical protein
MAKGFLKKLLNWKIYCSSGPAHMVAHHGPVRPSPNAVNRARGADPRTRPQPGPGPGKQGPAWAKRSPAAPSSLRPSDQIRRPSGRCGRNKTSRRAASPSNPRCICPLPLGLSFFLLVTATEAMAPPRASSPASALACT